MTTSAAGMREADAKELEELSRILCCPEGCQRLDDCWHDKGYRRQERKQQAEAISHRMRAVLSTKQEGEEASRPWCLDTCAAIVEAASIKAEAMRSQALEEAARLCDVRACGVSAADGMSAGSALAGERAAAKLALAIRALKSLPAPDAATAKIRRLASKGYRDAYMASRVRSTIAIQIRMLRRSLGYSQTKFAHQIGTTQSVISDLEDPDGDQVSVQTLLKIAAAVNVALVVRFAGFPDFLKLMGDMSPAGLAAENIDQTIGKQARQKAAAGSFITPSLLSLPRQRERKRHDG